MRLVAWTLVALAALVVFLLVRSPWGRLLRGVREDEDAIRSLGKNVFAIKMQALVLGGLFGAVSGMLYVLPASVVPDSIGRTLTFYCWTALLLGGAATVFGPVLGSILFFVVRILVTGLADNTVPDSYLNTQQAGQFGWIVIGVALMLLVIFRPQGVMGDKRELRFNV
jgi:branched-chain amino acid transport system permease protein